MLQIYIHFDIILHLCSFVLMFFLILLHIFRRLVLIFKLQTLSIDHIANPQNDVLWEGQGRKFDTKRATFAPLSFPQCIILEMSDMIYS